MSKMKKIINARKIKENRSYILEEKFKREVEELNIYLKEVLPSFFQTDELKKSPIEIIETLLLLDEDFSGKKLDDRRIELEVLLDEAKNTIFEKSYRIIEFYLKKEDESIKIHTHKITDLTKALSELKSEGSNEKITKFIMDILNSDYYKNDYESLYCISKFIMTEKEIEESESTKRIEEKNRIKKIIKSIYEFIINARRNDKMDFYDNVIKNGEIKDDIYESTLKEHSRLLGKKIFVWPWGYTKEQIELAKKNGIKKPEGRDFEIWKKENPGLAERSKPIIEITDEDNSDTYFYDGVFLDEELFKIARFPDAKNRTIDKYFELYLLLALQCYLESLNEKSKKESNMLTNDEIEEIKNKLSKVIEKKSKRKKEERTIADEEFYEKIKELYLKEEIGLDNLNNQEILNYLKYIAEDMFRIGNKNNVFDILKKIKDNELSSKAFLKIFNILKPDMPDSIKEIKSIDELFEITKKHEIPQYRTNCTIQLSESDYHKLEVLILKTMIMYRQIHISLGEVIDLTDKVITKNEIPEKLFEESLKGKRIDCKRIQNNDNWFERYKYYQHAKADYYLYELMQRESSMNEEEKNNLFIREGSKQTILDSYMLRSSLVEKKCVAIEALSIDILTATLNQDTTVPGSLNHSLINTFNYLTQKINQNPDFKMVFMKIIKAVSKNYPNIKYRINKMDINLENVDTWELFEIVINNSEFKKKKSLVTSRYPAQTDYIVYNDEYAEFYFLLYDAFVIYRQMVKAYNYDIYAANTVIMDTPIEEITNLMNLQNEIEAIDRFNSSKEIRERM